MSSFSRFVLAGLVTILALAACGTSSSPAGSSQTGCVKAPSDLVTSGSITWGSDVSYPPMEMMQNNQPVGVDIDLGNALALKMCVKSVFVNQSFDGILPALSAKKFDAILSAMAITAKRQLAADFVPYFKAGRVVIAKKGSGLHITSETQLCGHSLAIEAGTAELDEVKAITCPSGQSIHYTVFPTDTAAQEELRTGRVEMRLTSSLQGGYAVNQDSSLELISGVLGAPIQEGIGIRLGDAALKTALQDALSAVEADGTYAKILAKWGQTTGDIRS